MRALELVQPASWNQKHLLVIFMAIPQFDQVKALFSPMALVQREGPPCFWFTVYVAYFQLENLML